MMVREIRELSQLPVDHARPIKVVCIGAGYSGILAAIRLPQKIKNLDLTIYEKNEDIGGTWFENRYESSLNIDSVEVSLSLMQ